MRTKIVGVGNTMDSYGDKFQSAPNDDRGAPMGQYGKGDRDEYGGSKTGGVTGSYDPYQSTKPLSEKIGVILDDVDKVNDGDNADTIKQKLAGNKDKRGWV